MKESTNIWIVQLQAVPFVILNIVVVNIVFYIFNINYEFNKLLFLSGVIIFMPIHEVIHALMFPEDMRSDNVKFGVFPKHLVFFVFYTKEMSRNRVAFVLIAPFLIITMIGTCILLVFGDSTLVAHIVLMNAAASCADVMYLGKLLKQVPANALVRNKEIRTYWRAQGE